MDFIRRIISKVDLVLNTTSQHNNILRDIHDRCLALGNALRHVQQHVPNVLPKGRSDVVKHIHETLDGTLDKVTEVLAWRDVSPGQPVVQTLLAPHSFQVAVELHKVEALIRALKLPHSNIDDSIPATPPRSTIAEKYIELEVGRCGVEHTEHQTRELWKWKKLNSPEYLKCIREECLWDVGSLGNILNMFSQQLHCAKADTCPGDRRWFHLACCARSLLSARRCSEYLNILQSSEDSTLLIKDYLMELHLDLLGVFISKINNYQYPEWISVRIPRLVANDQLEPTPTLRRSHSTEDPRQDEPREIFNCDLGGQQKSINIGLRVGQSCSIHLRMTPWPVVFHYLRSIDLRTVYLVPGYQDGTYTCAIVTDRANSSSKPKLTFKHSSELQQFQALVTGYTVIRDYTKSCQVRIREHRLGIPHHIHFTGRIQLWDKDRTQDLSSAIPTITPSFTGFSNTSYTSVMTNATISTIKATKVLPSVQLSDEDGTTLITNFSPISPLLIVFVESSTHKRVRVSNILACCIPSPPTANIDKTLCECKNEASQCPRCFIINAITVDFQVGHYEVPRQVKKLDWVEITFKDKPERINFTKHLEARWANYNTKLQESQSDSKKVRGGHLNTVAYYA